MTDYNYKSIADPVYGSIGISKIEADIISTKSFLRLRHIEQLGLANFVFPSLNYSRFAHSIGVCHVTGRILRSLRWRSNDGPTPEQRQLYRIAGLLHDVGHYPFSHAMEHVIADKYSETVYEQAPSSGNDNGPIAKGGEPCERAEEGTKIQTHYKHERVGREVLEKDNELAKVLTKNGYDPKHIHSIFTRSSPNRYANLISSDLDADRIDYLLRTSTHSGLPYGSIDLKYILGQMRLDKGNNICLSRKALRAADHLLLSRFFDYSQVVYHKSIVGFELILKDVLRSLFDDNTIDCSAQNVSRMIAEGTWHTFDEIYIYNLIRNKLSVETDTILKLKLKSVLHRKPPKMVFNCEYLERRNQQSEFKNRIRIVDQEIKKWSEKYNIDPALWRIWDSKALVLTKIGSSIPLSGMDNVQEDHLNQSVRIHDEHDNSSYILMTDKKSITSILSEYSYYALRVYLLLPEDKANMYPQIKEEIYQDMVEVCP